MIPALFAALVAGLVWTLKASPRRAWLLMVPSMGGALWLAFAGLLPVSLASAAVLVLSGLAWWRRGEHTLEADPPVRASVLFLLVVLGLAAWLYPVGVGQLAPDQELLISVVPLAGAGGQEHPLGPESAPALGAPVRLLATSGLDPFLAHGLFAGLFQALALLLVFSGVLASTGAWLPGLLGAALLFGWGKAGWLLTVSMAQAAGQLLTSATLVSVVLGHRWAGAGFAAVTFGFDPALGWTAALALLLFELWNRERPLAALLPLLAGFSQGAWPHPAAPQVTLWLVAALLFLGSASPWVRAGLSLEVASWLAGGPVGCGAALAAGVGAGTWLAEAWRRAEPCRPRICVSKGLLLTLPRRSLVGLAVAVLLYLGLLPGESRFNDELLIAAHKRDVDLVELAGPVPLRGWVERFPEASQLTALDLEAVDTLRGESGPFVVLTPEAPVEPRRESALLAALTGRPVAGWHGEELLPPVAVARKAQSLAPLAGGPASQVLLRSPDQTLVLEVPSPPAATTGGELTGTPTPGVGVPFTAPTSYVVERNGQPFGWEVKAGELFLLPVTPGEYRLRLPGGATLGPWSSDLPATLANLRAGLHPPAEKPPSRSLVPVVVELFNPGPTPLSTGLFQGAVLSAFEPLGFERTTFPQPLQALPDLVLAPGERAEVELWVTTPEPEGKVPLRLELVDHQGRRFPVPFEPPAHLRTWRRLPPVGTWE